MHRLQQTQTKAEAESNPFYMYKSLFLLWPRSKASAMTITMLTL